MSISFNLCAYGYERDIYKCSAEYKRHNCLLKVVEVNDVQGKSMQSFPRVTYDQEVAGDDSGEILVSIPWGLLHGIPESFCVMWWEWREF